jgi:iron complex outermembrane receptor protein
VIDDAVSVRPAPQSGFAELFNLEGETRTHGTELLMRYRREPWGLTASHTYVHATEPNPSGAGRRTVPLTPRHAAGLIGVYERHGEGRAGVEIYYTGEQSLDDNPFQNTSDEYVVVGLLFEKRFGRVRAFLNLENVTDVRQTRYHPFVRPSPGPFGEWTTDAWAPLEGRVFNGGVRVAF